MKYVMTVSIVIVCSLIFHSCSTVISPELKSAVDENMTISVVRPDIETYVGRKVLWGGLIVRTVNGPEDTLIEIMALTLGVGDKPINEDESEGRFFCRDDRFLDPLIYREGRFITVIGEIEGKRTGVIGGFNYAYPVLKADKIRLWEERKTESITVYHAFHPYPLLPYWYFRGYP